MKIINRFPHVVRVIENCWIPMSDGCRVAARIWLPAGAETTPVPAILEYIPYRKRDFTRARDEPMHHYFAGHGYAAVRVDLRGSGDSDGLLLDEYLKQEHDDALEVIRWIARQPWCSGAVGMMGKSWGGFNSLQVAARRPPELKAIITVCSTDDRYPDDVHYMGGCLLNENLTWGSVLMSYNAYPPDPELVGERWRAMWRDRLEHAVFFPDVWLEHPRRDDYQTSLADTLNSLGALHGRAGRTKEGEAALDEARAIRARLARDHPHVVSYRSRLANVLDNLGLFYKGTGRPEKALECHREAWAIHERLARENPSVTQLQAKLAWSLGNLGNLQGALGRPAEALASYERARTIYERVVRHLPSELSAGERQRVAIARALANEPRLLLADEPTGALDSASSDRILGLLAATRERHGMTMIIASHDPVVTGRADRVVRLVDGTVRDG